jgi:hypothetical protein
MISINAYQAESKDQRNAARQAGKECGAKWRRECDDPKAIDAMQQMHEQAYQRWIHDDPEIENFGVETGMAYGAGREIYYVLHGRTPPDAEVNSFFEGVADAKNLDYYTFFLGFIEGAVGQSGG